MKRILELNNTEARQFFLKGESYFNFDLPKYFVFDTILQQISQQISGRRLSDFYSSVTNALGQPKPTYPHDYEDVNYKFLNNKDGRFSWRPFQLIHPALYVSLVHAITEEVNWNLIVTRFEQFASNTNIKCYSIPLESEGDLSDKATTIVEWWHSIEQQSITLALTYDYVLHTDISDCYGSIYTHSVPWAIHTKPIAKADRSPNGLIGNTIDKHLRDMSFGQTNGIPQGSVLMDFIAEMILGFADLELSEKIQEANIQDYQIIRYRDDYRIFTNNPQTAEHITKFLTEILITLGMRLNTQKTLVSNNVIRSSIKPDKLFWMTSKRSAKNIQEHLFLLHNLSENFPNSGSLNKALNKFFNRIIAISETKQNMQVLISMLVDIMYKNPRTYPIAAAILSKLLLLLDNTTERDRILQAIYTKFDKIPNTGHIKIWLQRVTIKIDRTRIYEENLCKKVNDPNIRIWNSDWLSNTLRTLITDTPIISEEVIEEIDIVIDSNEVQLFHNASDYDENLGGNNITSEILGFETVV